MQIKNDFKIITTLHENSSTIIYRARRLSNNESVIIKELKHDSRNEYRINQFINEEKILSKLNSNGIVKILDIVSKPSIYYHLLEDINGDSLFNIILNHQFTLDESLDIALASLEALHYLHQNGIIHFDINPKNIIYNIETKALQLIDFGISISKEDLFLNDKKNLNSSGNIFYIPPEQTGLTEYCIDNRSDIYSLGMSLYHLFLGSLPLKAKDQYEVIHKQISLMPTPLSKVDTNIPKIISLIIEKMISKNPYKRYQSVEAIIYDIKKCITHLDKHKNIKYFQIATLDKPNIKIDTVIVGRDKELSTLKNALQKTEQIPLNILLSGMSGVGKTRLVNEVLLSFDDTDSFNILIGKFDKYKGHLPYTGFRQIFSCLSNIVSEKYLKQCILNMHPDTPKILNMFFPTLNKLLGIKNNKIKITDLLYSKDQLSFAIKDFLHHIATNSKPLIIFFDDIQWIDQASSELLKASVLHSSNPNIRFIATLRDNENIQSPPLINILKCIKNNSSHNILNIQLSDLSKQDVVEIIKTTLNKDKIEAPKLANVIYKKTAGNPFYIKIFIESLLDGKELYFEKGEWKYTLSKIKTYNPSDNVIELLTSKIQRLNNEETLYIQYLAILGAKFDISLALDIMQKYGLNNQIMKKLIQLGFIYTNSTLYQFTHDTLQQDVLSLLKETTRYKIHKDIGLYLEKLYHGNNYYNIIVIAYHLNRAYPIDKVPKRLFKLNMMSISELLKVNSHSLALAKINWIDKIFFNEQLWGNDYALALKYSLLKVKALYLNSELLKANKQIILTIDKCKTIKDKCLCFNLLKDISITRGKDYQKTIQFGNKLLKEMGTVVPNNKKDLSTDIIKMENEILNHRLFKKPQDILTHSKLKNNNFKSISALLVQYWELAYYLSNIELMRWCYLKITQISFKYGNSTESAFAYVLYSSYLISQKEYKKAQLFGTISLKLNAEFNDLAMLPKIHNFVANFINPYSKNIKTNIKLYDKSLIQSKINGDIVLGTWANFLMHFSNFLSGSSIDSLKIDIDNESSFILQSGDEKMISIFNVLKENLNELQNQEASSSTNKKNFLDEWINDKFYPALAWYAIIKAQNCLLYNEIDKGLKLLDTYIYSELNEVIMFPKIYLHIFRALLLLQSTTDLSNTQIKTLESDLNEVNSYYKNSPSTFKFYKLLLDAELNKEKELIWDVAKRYDKAINQAKKDKNSFFIALSNLFASRFWNHIKYIDIKTIYLNEAIVGFNQWGAFNLAKKLKSNVSHTGHEHSSKQDTINTYMSSSSRVKQSSYQSLIKSHNAISKSKNNKELIKTFMGILLQNAVASSGVLILREKKEFYIKAVIDYEKDTFELKHERLDAQRYLPNSVIQNVITMEENIILHHPAESGRFQFDPYFKKNKPASSIFVVIKLEDQVEAILYIQNNEIATNIDKENIQTLEMLLTQVTIVFNNITLYENLKQNDESLNKAQELLHVGSWSFNSLDEKIIWSKETYKIFDIKPFSIEITYGLFLSFIHPDDLEYLKQSHDKALTDGEMYVVEHRIITAKGNTKFVKQKAEISNENGITRMSGTMQDITETKESKKEISALTQVIEQSPTSIAITNTFGDIEYINTMFTTLTGYTQDELIGKNMNILSSKKNPFSFYEKLWKTVLGKKEMWSGLMIDKTKDGRLIELHTIIFPILDTNNRPVKLVAIQEDVTEKNIKDKLFLIQTRQAQMGEMISMIAHQWRQPLGAISATAINLKIGIELEKYDLDTKNGQEAQNTYFTEQLEKIENFVVSLSTTIDDFRNFYRPNKKPVITTLSKIVSKSLNIISSSIKNSNIALEQEHKSQETIELYDSEMIQVILNILKNAQDAFEENEIKDAKITITTDKNTISICDNAGGIPQDIIDNIFEVYFSTKTEMNGTGLGLHMAKTIIQKHHNGTIEAISLDGGTCFHITLGKASHTPPRLANE